MQFLYPEFLWALFALIVPVLIHLFSFRRYQTVYFSNVSFLAKIQRKTKNKSRIKHLIILILRMLAFAALVFAFALPYIPASPGEKAPAKNEIVLYIDNSFSMESVNEEGTLLEVAKNKAIQIVDQLPGHLRYFVLTNDFDPRHKFPKTSKEAIREITSIETSPFPTDFKKINRFAQNREKDEVQELYIISDFQENSSDLSSLKNDTSQIISLIPIPSLPTGNLYIDSCRFVSPVHRINHKEELIAWITNKSEESLSDIPLKLIVNDSLTAVANFSIEANETEEVVLKFTNHAKGNRKGKLIIHDYPVTYDNKFVLTWNVEDKREILAIMGNTTNRNEAERMLAALLKDDPFTSLKIISENEIKIGELSSFPSIVLANPDHISTGISHQLSKFAKQGGNLILFPSFYTPTNELNEFLNLIKGPLVNHIDTLKSRINKVNFSHPVFDEVFRKKIKEFTPIEVPAHFRWNISPAQKGSSLLTMNNRQPALYTLPVEKGNVSIFSFPLQFSPFTRHSLFVPTLYNLLFFSLHHEKLYNIIGEEAGMTFENTPVKSHVLSVTNLKSGELFYPETWVSNENTIHVKLEDHVSKAGFYQLSGENQLFALNYDRKESNLRCLTNEELQMQIEKYNLKNIRILKDDWGFTNIISGQTSEQNLWKWFLLAALCFIIIEGVLLRISMTLN